MKIGFVSLENPYSLKNNGGIGTYTGVIAEGIAQLGHDVHVITVGDMDVATREHEIKPHLMAHYFQLDSGTKYCTHLEAMVKIKEKVRQVKEQYGLDLVEIPEWSAQGYVVATEGVVPTVTRLHTPLFLIERIGESQIIYREQEEIKRLEYLQTKRSNAVTSPSQSLADLVTEEWGVQSAVIPNPIDLRSFQLQEVDQGQFDELGDYILFMGRLEYRKGVLTLGESLKYFLSSHPHLKVVFCGQNTFYKKRSIKAMLEVEGAPFKEQLHFIPHVSAGSKIELLRKAVLVVLPSVWENFSYVALEALALGKTVVASEVGGFPEMIQSGRTGYLVPQGNPKELGVKIDQILSGELPFLGQEAERWVQSHLDIDVVAPQFMKYFDSLL